MAGALADFSRRPPGVRVAVYVAIALVLGLIYYQMMLGPVRKAVTEAESNRDAAIAEAGSLNDQKKKRDALVQTQEKLHDKIEQNQKALPTDAEMPAFFDMLARKFNEAGVQVNRREIKREVQVEDFIKAPVEIEITGSYYQIKQFFSSLRPHMDEVSSDDAPGVGAADKDRIVTVENLTVYDPRVANNQLILTAKFTASTFRTVPVPETPVVAPAAGAPAAGAPAAKGAPTPTPGPATSRPPLSPASAKRAAEDAYKASDARAREAAAAAGDPLPDSGSAAPAPKKGAGLDRIQGGL